MKKVLLLCLAFAITITVKSQSIQLFHEGSDVTNKTIKVSVDTSEAEAYTEVQIKNATGSAKDVKVKRVLKNEISGSENYMCFAGNCYPPFVAESDIQEIQSLKVDSGFSTHYVHYNNCGTTKILFVFFNANNTNDSATVTVEYEACAPAGIVELDPTSYKIYPNPANTFMVVEFQGKVLVNSVTLFDVAGKRVNCVVSSSMGNSLRMETGNLPEGIYVVQLSNGEQMAFRKITVTH